MPEERLWQEVAAGFPERIVGLHGDTRAILREVARRCGARPDEAALDAAVLAQHAGVERMRPPRPVGLVVLERLREAGFRLGLISDCASELCEAWPQTLYAPSDRRRRVLLNPNPANGSTKPSAGISRCMRRGATAAAANQHGTRRAGMRAVLATNAAWLQTAAHLSEPERSG